MKPSEELAIPVGTRVRNKAHGNETGVIEEYRADGYPLVRYDYGNLLRAYLGDLEVIKKEGEK